MIDDILEMLMLGATVITVLAAVVAIIIGVMLLYETQHYVLFGIFSFLIACFIIGGIMSGAHS